MMKRFPMFLRPTTYIPLLEKVAEKRLIQHKTKEGNK